MPRSRSIRTSQPVIGRSGHVLRFLCSTTMFGFVLVILGLLAADVVYLTRNLTWQEFGAILRSHAVLSALRMSLITSAITLGLVLLTAIPVGYALSRYRFPGHALLDTIIDVPIVLPPVVLGLSLLAFFGTGLGEQIRRGLALADWSLISGLGIVMCQYLVAVSYCIRAVKAAFDSVDRRLEEVSLALGCSHWGAFRRVTLPLAKNGLLAGAIMAWARAIGVFGPLMVFVGTSPRVQVMPTMMWLELSIGNIEVSLAVALLSVVLAGTALAVVHWLAQGKEWL